MLQPLQRCRYCMSTFVATSKQHSRRRQRLDFQTNGFQYFRHFSASAPASPKQSVDQSSNNRSHDEASSSFPILPLYQRDGDRMTLPRAALGMSALNTTYWLWYSLDFIPAVNASPMQDLHIDPKIGWGALALGIVINGLTALYPALLVSRMDYNPSQNEIRVYRHTLPLLSPSAQSTDYPLGEVSIDTSDSDLKKILGEYMGDWTKYKGHLALKRKNQSVPLLMEIQNGRQEVKNGEALLQAMLRPKALLSSTTNEKQKLKGKNTKTKSNMRSKSRQK